ncbi:MAG TPA: hypothetical protein PKV93_01405 [Fervidobacterium sp.]|nr:hypothetical protein [Fervidobacterium sp.]
MMGEIPSDIRAILEALARKDISIEEAEQLILSIKQKESYQSPKEKKYEKSFLGKEFILRKGEEHTGNVEAVNSKIIIEGTINGDLEIAFCDVSFSGEVKGDVQLVGSTIKWNGGTIDGDLELVGCTYSGNRPKVSGRVEEINNFFINGILGTVKYLVVKPFLSGIKVEE